MWLSEDVFEWHAESAGGGRLSDAARVARPYEILHHARQLVQSSNSSLVRGDALSNLKRSINVRLQHIEELYRFSGIFPKNTGTLERLEVVGLARPFLIKQLFELRNDVEHNDSDPPDGVRLSELVDIAWYFLKATDPACKVVPDGISFKCQDSPFARNPPLGIAVYPVPGNADSVAVAGWLSPLQLHEKGGPGLLSLKVEECRGKPLGPISDEPDDQLAYMINRMRGDDERWIEGSVVTPAQLQQRLWRLSLEAN
jgi:hypothetical protein